MLGGMGRFVLGVLFGIVICFLAGTFVLTPTIMPVFSPEGGHEIISLIDSAQKTLDIEMYVFTSRDVVEALERAKARGVDVRVIIERNVISGGNDAMYQELAAKGFNIRYASRIYALTHSKFMIIDGGAVLVGSHNFSNSALYENREASVIIRSADIARQFADVFATDWAIAT
ncbi:DUF1669 domain-containing protein [Candidatus Micrarchaeota archaeon]|nr:DUF1669 domain-containing protein [Candidatus Micrarchaeota archaeon]